MPRYSITIFMWIFLINGTGVNAQDDDPWKFVKEQKGINIYTRKTNESPIKQVKVQTIMNTTLGALVAVMIDVPNHKEWVYAVKMSEKLEFDDELSWLYYGQISAPWPVSDRDVVSRAVLSQDSISRIVRNITFGIPEYLPEEDGFVRVQEIESLWTLSPLEDGKVQVEFELKIDLSGNIPAWLVNMVITKGPVQSIFKLSQVVQKAPYKNARLDYIIN